MVAQPGRFNWIRTAGQPGEEQDLAGVGAAKKSAMEGSSVGTLPRLGPQPEVPRGWRRECTAVVAEEAERGMDAQLDLTLKPQPAPVQTQEHGRGSCLW